MTKRIAIGFKSYDEHEKHVEVTIVGDGDRAHVDYVLSRAHEADRGALTTYLSPFVEGGQPPRNGDYRERLVMWWKAVEVLG